MKGYFCVLRHGVRKRNIERFDDIWNTCCALYDMLLIIDGLYKNWESSACSNWETSNDNYENINQGKFSINCLNNPIVGCREE